MQLVKILILKVSLTLQNLLEICILLQRRDDAYFYYGAKILIQSTGDYVLKKVTPTDICWVQSA